MLSEKLARTLAQEIISGKLKRGVRLEEVETAARFSVSRTPVREALNQLCAMGLAERRPRRGVIVSGPSQGRIEEMFVAMGEMEAVAARLAALNMTPAQRTALQQLHEDSAAPMRDGDEESYSAFNNRFHALLYAGCGNSYIEELLLTMRNRLSPYRRAQFNVLGRLALSYKEHDAIVQAVLRGDGDGAAHAMRTHLKVVGDAAFEYVEKHTPGDGSALEGPVAAEQETA